MFGAAGTAAVGAAGLAVGWLAWRKVSDWLAEDLRGKTVLITGGSRGLGYALAHEFARHGARVAICARNPQELEWARQELQRVGAEVVAIPCDVSDNEQVQRMVHEVTQRLGRIDILVNNAGIIAVGPVEAQTLEDFDEAMKIMFWGVVYPTLAVLPQMLERRRGRIANITSIGGKVAVPHLVPYDCAKFAAVGFSEGMCAELAKDGIKVTTVVPGLMRTGSNVNAFFKGQHRAEYTLFSLMGTSPLTAVPGQRAAKRIVRAVRLGRSEVILTPQAKLLAMFHGLFPGQTANIMGLVNRVLPRAAGPTDKHLGKESETPLTRSPLTALGRRAGAALHQYPERMGAEQVRAPGFRSPLVGSGD